MIVEEEPGVGSQEWLAKHLSRRNVSRHWQPVMLYRDNLSYGMGNIYLDALKNERIVTAGHLFAKKDGAHMWTYQRLRPFRNCREPIVGANLVTGTEHLDVAICIPGTIQPPLIPGFSDIHSGKGTVEEQGLMIPFVSPVTICSTVSGIETTAVGVLKLEQGRADYFVLPNRVQWGESGTGFVDETDQSIYILRGNLNIDADTTRRFESLFGASYFSLASKLTPIRTRV